MFICVPQSNVFKKAEETDSSQIGVLLQSWNNDFLDCVILNFTMDFYEIPIIENCSVYFL